jgi:hypothetical protein
MADQETKKCSNCSRAPQLLSEFRVGEKEYKTCKFCRDKGKKNDTKRREDPEKKEERNARGREMKYYQSYRERKREEDFEGYRANINKVRSEWMEKNRDNMRQWSKMNVNDRLRKTKESAVKRNKSWNLDDEFAKELMTRPCHYCGLIDMNIRVNGIDRVDNTIGYCPSNVVPCCKLCNYFKKNYTVDEFLAHAKRITEHQALVTQLV